MDFNKLIEFFKIEGGCYVGMEAFGMGHINDTYALSFDEKGTLRRYVAQRVNKNIFPDIDALMENIVSVTEFLRNEIRNSGGSTKRECLKFLQGENGKYYYTDEDGENWRVYRLVDNAYVYQVAENAAVFEDAGRAFGVFVRRLSGFDASNLHEIIANFHNTPSRVENFKKALANDPKGRKESCLKEVDFALKREKFVSKIVDALAAGKIPVRVTHNDTKLNNVLFDADTKKAICVIDLDTIMPGSLLYDFGDAIRSGCSTALEDEQDLEKVHFDLQLFNAFTKGFLGAMGGSITDAERELLPFSAILMTYECGVRFLTDYLNGDTYFKVKYAEHNLVRCRTQFKLIEEMEEKLKCAEI